MSMTLLSLLYVVSYHANKMDTHVYKHWDVWIGNGCETSSVLCVAGPNQPVWVEWMNSERFARLRKNLLSPLNPIDYARIHHRTHCRRHWGTLQKETRRNHLCWIGTISYFYFQKTPLLICSFRASMHNCVKHVKSSISNTPPRSKRNRFHGHSKAVISLDWHKRVPVKQQPLHFLSFKSFGRTHNHFSPVSWLLPGMSISSMGPSRRKLMIHL